MDGSSTETYTLDAPLQNLTSLLSGLFSDSAFSFLTRHVFFVLSEIHLFLTISDKTSSFSSTSGLELGQYTKDLTWIQLNPNKPLLLENSDACWHASSSHTTWWSFPQVIFFTWMGFLRPEKVLATAKMPFLVSKHWDGRWWSEVMSPTNVEWSLCLLLTTVFWKVLL